MYLNRTKHTSVYVGLRMRMAKYESDRIRKVQLGTRDMTFPSDELGPLDDSTHNLGDREALLSSLQEKGYLYIRGLHDRQGVLSARLAVLDHIKQAGPDKLDTRYPWQQGILDSRCGHNCIPFMEGKEEITHHSAVRKVLESDRVKALFWMLFEEEPLTFNYKWLRGVPRDKFTGAHVDRVYMGRGTDRLYTMWTPLDDVTVEMGTLAVCEASHALPQFDRLQDTYGNVDVEQIGLKGTGWFTNDPLEITNRFGGEWKTADFAAGDVLIFTLRTVHMSTANLTDKVRISCDTRWQPSSEKVDQRYMQNMARPEEKAKFGLYAEDNAESTSDKVTMAQLKRRWGFTEI